MINWAGDELKSSNSVKFISYTGKYPNLCRGVLTLEIEGENIRFGHDYSKHIEFWSKDEEGRLTADGNYDAFWESGGGCRCFDDCDVETEEWIINESELPEKYRKYIREIDSVFNENVEFGCCGGCI